MAKDPAFLFYSKDWLSGCQFMSFEERGIYITLLCAQHQNGHLDKKRVGFLLGLGWDLISDIVKSKFKEDAGGSIFNERLDLEIEKRKIFIEKQISNGLKGGRPKKNNPNNNPNETQTEPKKNPTGIVIGNGNVIEDVTKEGVKGENIEGRIEALIFSSLGDIYIESIRLNWKHIDFDQEVEAFKQKVRGSPEEYVNRDSLRTALQYQLRNAKKATGPKKELFDLSKI